MSCRQDCSLPVQVEVVVDPRAAERDRERNFTSHLILLLALLIN